MPDRFPLLAEFAIFVWVTAFALTWTLPAAVQLGRIVHIKEVLAS